MPFIADFDLHSPLTWMRIGIASVCLLFGLIFKAVGFLPRHRQIVARVVGEQHAGLILWSVALAEIGLSAWTLIGRFIPVCMAIQTVFIAAMNFYELRDARDLLLTPWGMVCANVVFLSAGWYVALAMP